MTRPRVPASNRPLAVIALGSNVGDSRTLLLRALDALRPLSRGEFKSSSLWRSAPVDCPPGSPDFLNAVCVLEPDAAETPESFLDHLQALERAFGRIPKSVHNEPRTLDLDLIAFGDVRQSEERLILPHPRAHERRFVLGPLCEIAPDLTLPGGTATVSELLGKLPADHGVAVPVPGGERDYP